MHRSLLLLPLLVLTACSEKEESKPATAPALEGTWSWQRGTETDYDASGNFLRVSAQIGAPGSRVLVITPQALQHYDGSGNALGTPTPYTLQGNAIVRPSPTTGLTYTELTEHTLVLHYPGTHTFPTAGHPGGHTDIDAYYTR